MNWYLRKKAIADLYSLGWSADDIAAAMKYTRKFIADSINAIEEEKARQLPGDLNDTILGYQPRIVEAIKSLNIGSCKELRERLQELETLKGFGPKTIEHIERMLDWAKGR